MSKIQFNVYCDILSFSFTLEAIKGDSRDDYFLILVLTQYLVLIISLKNFCCCKVTMATLAQHS